MATILHCRPSQSSISLVLPPNATIIVPLPSQSIDDIFQRLRVMLIRSELRVVHKRQRLHLAIYSDLAINPTKFLLLWTRPKIAFAKFTTSIKRAMWIRENWELAALFEIAKPFCFSRFANFTVMCQLLDYAVSTRVFRTWSDVKLNVVAILVLGVRVSAHNLPVDGACSLASGLCCFKTEQWNWRLGLGYNTKREPWHINLQKWLKGTWNRECLAMSPELRRWSHHDDEWNVQQGKMTKLQQLLKFYSQSHESFQCWVGCSGLVYSE